MRWLAPIVFTMLAAGTCFGQGSRHDDIVLGPQGHPVSSATITVCTGTATGTPCSPLAQLFTDATLSVPASNPFQSDSLGNYHFYGAPGRYVVQISGPGLNGTMTFNACRTTPRRRLLAPSAHLVRLTL